MSTNPVACTTPMCDAGYASVQAMDSVFQSAPPNVQASYQSAHDSIMQSFNSVYSFYSDWIPFNPDCCTLQSLGQQADQIAYQMQLAMGQNPSGTGPATQAAPMSISSLVILGVVAFFALSYIGNRV